MPISHTEYLSLVPLSALAAIYWLRDRYLFNRAPRWHRSTIVQRQVLLLIYPAWVLFGWILGLQTGRQQVLPALLSSTAQHLSGHYTVVGILNDSFRMTRQQVIGFAFGLLISYVWTAFWLLVSRDEACDVERVVAQNGQCDCNRTAQQ